MRRKKSLLDGTTLRDEHKEMLKETLFSAIILVMAAPGGNHAADGIAKVGVGDYVGAMDSFRRARSGNMDKTAFLAWGKAALALGKYRSAAAKFGMAAGRDSSDGDPLALMGEAYLRAGDFQEAVAAFARIGKRPLSDPIGARILWATATNGAGVYAQGLAMFRQVKKKAPPGANIRDRTGRGGLPHRPEAIRRSGRALGTSPSDRG